ncbi:transposase [Sinorhizobium meliloti]|uniref:transposase n=1 Tax=Rhizobium meliloti TaxID=382 RepID=UPI000FD9A5B0|nr:hypothetical protein CN245_29300 [Sinorhizobium meliloti]
MSASSCVRPSIGRTLIQTGGNYPWQVNWRSVSAIAHRIGIHPSQLFAWRRNARTDASPQRSADQRRTSRGGPSSDRQRLRSYESF